MISVEQFLTGAALILLLSVFASKASEKYGIPALLLFLLLGMLAGSEGAGGVYFDVHGWPKAWEWRRWRLFFLPEASIPSGPKCAR